jgi:stage II sporulation SpoE-like protein
VWEHARIDGVEARLRARSDRRAVRPRLIRLLALGLEDSPRARRLVAATLYAVFVPMVVAVELSGGATDAHAAAFWAVTGFLVAQLVLTLTVEISDRVAAFLVVAVPVSYAAYAGVAFRPTDSLWPCLVLPVVWCSLFLPPGLVVLSVVLNAAAGASGFAWPTASHPSAVVVVIRTGTLAVAAAIIAGLVWQIRGSRDRYHAAADTLQATLAPPRLPQLPGLAVAATYLPLAERGIVVGGDFYDVFPCPDGSYALCVGDVEGKGLEAAAVTGLVRHELRSQLYLGATAAAALAHLNATLTERRANRSCTLVVALLRPAAGGCEVRVARAGHPAPVIVREGRAEELAGGLGPLLGMDAAAAYSEATVRLQAGDQLLLYTDGVTEARRAGELFGQARLRAALEAAAEPSPQASCDRIADAMRDFADAPSDDVTVLAVGLA